MPRSKKFVRSAYWGTWSRLLATDHPMGKYIEVNLTPIPNCGSRTWDSDVAPIIIRAHSTQRKPDELHDAMPLGVYMKMVEHLGVDLAARLLDEDFLPQIDWDLYRRHNNGGARLESIRHASYR